MEALFQRKHNQLSVEERQMIDYYKKEITQRITHVMDCEAYTNKKKTFLREISVYRVKTGECSSFQVYMPFVPFNERNYTIRYQINKVHGLPIINTRLTDDFYTLEESMDFLTDEFMRNADLVAYKGGDIERNLLNNMGVRCINLEVLSCPKYANLLTKYGHRQECCQYHLGDYFHCSKHEVKVFAHFVQTILKEASV
ncbi:Hypothetical predicted protein [Paramuricea clavata]|uniref:Uncharacterized protein n=1 Tax=Paramuricea clavata TaxID=317549 RepID=A0A6S7J8I0_PARCT|nr:Hypothetical predicted protein [Paramuricea clavata]